MSDLLVVVGVCVGVSAWSYILARVHSYPRSTNGPIRMAWETKMEKWRNAPRTW